VLIENKFNNISLIVIVSFIESIGASVYSVLVAVEVEVLLVAEVEELWQSKNKQVRKTKKINTRKDG
jgi:hypothetical protein